MVGQLVQVPGAVDFGGEHTGELLGGEPGDEAIVEHTGEVEHGG